MLAGSCQTCGEYTSKRGPGTSFGRRNDPRWRIYNVVVEHPPGGFMIRAAQTIGGLARRTAKAQVYVAVIAVVVVSYEEPHERGCSRDIARVTGVRRHERRQSRRLLWGSMLRSRDCRRRVIRRFEEQESCLGVMMVVICYWRVACRCRPSIFVPWPDKVMPPIGNQNSLHGRRATSSRVKGTLPPASALDCRLCPERAGVGQRWSAHSNVILPGGGEGPLL
ncbi:hypothetical protein EV126DRAFT_160611 [Verticillium dahliae]|nr:hypothetical protein EV126DRAFT_160611 [Verticillium dahliae]